MKAPKQKRSQRTLARILESAVELFDQDGVDATGISDVAKHAGSSVGSLYGRFEGKTDLVIAVEALLWDRVAARWADAGGSNERPSVGALLDRLQEALGPERFARASVQDFLQREQTESTGPHRVARLKEEVRGSLVAQLGAAPGSRSDVVSLLADLALQAADGAGDGGGDESAKGPPPLEFVIDAALARMSGRSSDAKPESSRVSLADPFDIWA